MSNLLNFVDSIQAARLSRVAVDRVQARSFSVVRLNSDAESLRQFDQVFQDESLRDLVKLIEFDAVLPPVSDKRLRKYQSTAEARANATAFSQAIFQLFSRIQAWQSRPSPSGAGIHLNLTATSPSDDPDVYARPRRPLQNRNAYKYVTFDKQALGSSTSLPPVRCITALDWDNFDRRTSHRSARRLHPAAVAAMTAVLPSLEQSTWHITMPTRRLTPQRKEIRSALADTLAHLPQNNPGLKSLVIHLEDMQPRNERAELESYVEAGEEDPLSKAVHAVCQLPSLSSVEFRGSWILSAVALEGVKLGPALEIFHVDVAATTPCGGWHLDELPPEDQQSEVEDSEPEYYEDYGVELQPRVLPEIDSGDSDREDPELPAKALRIADLDVPSTPIRGLPNQNTLVPLLGAFARAVDEAGSVPRSSIREAQACLAAPGMMLQASLALFAAGKVEKDAFGRKTEVLEQPTWKWAAWGPYGQWEMPAEVREFLHGDIRENVRVSCTEHR